MSLTITNQPFDISLSNNPIIYEFKTDALYEGLFVYPYIEIEDIGTILDGYSFSFEFTDPTTLSLVQLRFTAKDSPDNSGLEFLSYQGGNGFVWRDQMLKDFKKNTVLSTYYNIELYGNVFRFTAKKAEKGFIPVNFSQNISGRMQATIVDVAEKPNKIKDLRVNLEVYFEDDYMSNNWSLVAESSSIPDASGIVYFDIGGIISSACKNSYSNNPPVPNLSNDQLIYNSNLNRRYYIRYAESTEYSQGVFKASKASLIHYGGISQEDFTKGNFFLYVQSLKMFSNWLEDNKTLSPNQPNYLNWINTTNKEIELAGYVIVQYTDGSATNEEKYTGSMTLLPWESATLATGYDQLNLNQYNPSKEVLKWEVYLMTPDYEKLSEFKTFYLDYNHYECNNYLLFLNSLNSPEVIATVGSWKKGLSVSRQFATKALVPDYKLINGQTYQYDNNSRNIYTVRTGYLSKKEIETLQDLLLGAPLFLIENNNYIPTTIDGNSFDITECLTFLNSLEFVVKKSFAIKQYSNIDFQVNLEAVYDCGVVGFRLNKNNLEVSNIQKLIILDAVGNTVSATNYSAVTGMYTFAEKLTLQGVYSLNFEVIVNGKDASYIIPFTYENETFSYEVTTYGSTTINLVSSQTTPVYVDWGDGSALEEFTVTSGSNPLAHSYANAGTKKIKMQTPCNKLLTYFVNGGDNSVSRLDIEGLVNLELILVNSANLEGNLNIQNLEKLKMLNLYNSNLSSINIGFHRYIESFEVNGNNLNVEQIEILLYNFWKYRKGYANTAIGIDLNISNNPGAGSNLSARSLDIINGTATTDFVFYNEGLATAYNWNITL